MSEELEKAREVVRLLEEKEKQNKVELFNLHEGETFFIGDIEFIVLREVSDGKLFVITKGFVAENEEFGNSRDYRTSNVRNILENEFLPKIESEIGSENIVPTTAEFISVDMQRKFDDLDNCKVRLLTFDETREYNRLLVSKDIWDWWWTCTPWSREELGWDKSIAVVSPSGDLNFGSYFSNFGVRPVLYLKSNIFVSRGEK